MTILDSSMEIVKYKNNIYNCIWENVYDCLGIFISQVEENSYRNRAHIEQISLIAKFLYNIYVLLTHGMAVTLRI